MVNYLGALHGIIPGVDDAFTHTLAISSPGPALTVAESLRDNWVTMWTEAGITLSQFFSAQVSYTHATAAEILDLDAADATLASAARAEMATARVGTGPAKHPTQVAWAVSLRGGTYPNGVPVKGRFYLPVPGLDVGADGLIPTSSSALLADAMQTFLSRLTSEGHIPSVWSRGAPRHGVVAGFLTTVNQVRVGGKLDTIRSRRNATPETYVERVVPLPT